LRKNQKPKNKMQYSKKTMEHFMHPKNMGEIKNPDGVGEVGNPTCGDIMKVFIKVSKDKKTGKEKIKEIKFQTFGCASAIASSSVLTEMAKGKTFQQAESIKMKDIANELGGLPKIKLHCSAMASEALQKAIQDYKNKSESKNKQTYFSFFI
jgi:nitrogen fixation NifU-like protein